MITADKILKLVRQLYPTGRAFKLAVGTRFRELHAALAETQAQAVNDAAALLDQILPDNTNYTGDDAATWEAKLQIPIAPAGVSLADRKLAILRKMRHPGDRLPRQSIDFIEDELRAAGFDVYCFENKFGGEVDFIKVGAGTTLYRRYANTTYFRAGTRYQAITVDQNATGVVISQLDEANENVQDQSRTSLRSTFIICGATYPNVANVDAAREREFRNLIMTLKPAHTHAFLFVNYV
jgi:hypothetical protein